MNFNTNIFLEHNTKIRNESLLTADTITVAPNTASTLRWPLAYTTQWAQTQPPILHTGP